MVQLLLELSASIRILSVRHTITFCNNSFGTHPQTFRTEYLLYLTQCTCSFCVACDSETLKESFSRVPVSQLLPVEPDQQHPVSMLLIAVLTCEQKNTAPTRQENDSVRTSNQKIPSSASESVIVPIGLKCSLAEESLFTARFSHRLTK